MREISMLWPAEDGRQTFPDFRFVQDLRLDSLFPLRAGAPIGAVQDNLSDYFTMDLNSIRYRQELFSELLENNSLYLYLKKAFSTLSDFFQMQADRENAMSAEQQLFSVKEMETYVGFLQESKEIFDSNEVKSTALLKMLKMRDYLQPLFTGKEFEALARAVSEQSHIIKNIRSISVGINLDPQLRPYEAGVIAIHEREYKSGDLIPRLLRLDLRKDDFSCAAPLVPIDKKLDGDERNALRAGINASLNKVLLPTLKSWAGTVKKYVISSLRELNPILREWRFIEACMQTMLSLRQNGYPLCLPEFGKTDAVEDLYHPWLALSGGATNTVVKNDLCFDETGRIFILTGPNQGGKTVYLQAVGIMYAMLHLGMLLPAKKAIVCPADAILTHFVDKQHTDAAHGRLSGECSAIQKNNQWISEHSLFLYDEALTSTDAAEAVGISREVLKAYAIIGARGIWTTHYHELCRLEQELTEGKNRIGNLSAEMDTDTHRRAFRIQRGNGLGQSYARDIAAQYHLTAEEILSSRLAETPDVYKK